MSEEEKQAIDWLKEELDDEKKSCKNRNYSYKGVTGLYGNNEVEIALKLIEKQQKKIEFYEMQELEYIQGYEDGKSHKQTAVAIKNENAQYELIKRVIEEKDKEIEKLKSRKYIFNAETNEIKEIPISDDYICKDKIKEKIDLIDKEYAEIIEKNKNDLYLVNINAQRHSAMQSILEELLGE